MRKIEWMREHTNCPNCKGQNVAKTDKAVSIIDENNYSDDVNTAYCSDCGWKGMLKNLVPDPQLEEKKKAVEEIKIAIRTIDHVEEDGSLGVYMNGKDIMESIEVFGQKLINNLTDEVTIEYTDKLLNEIFKIFMGTMLSHAKSRVAKEMEELKEKEEVNKEKE